MKSSDHGFRAGALRRTAKEVRNYRVMVKILVAGIAAVASLMAAVFVGAALYKNTGAFTISLNKEEMRKYGLTLSETADMRYKTSYLNARIEENMTNIDGKLDIPSNVDEGEGEHNGQDYIAYSFYLQNAGELEVSYEYSIAISNITNGLDDAIRVKLYKDGVPTTYAKSSRTIEGCEPDADEEFYSSTEVVRGRTDKFKPGDKTKYTVVVWIEGNDPECLDYAIGGTVKLDMKMSILDIPEKD